MRRLLLLALATLLVSAPPVQAQVSAPQVLRRTCLAWIDGRFEQSAAVLGLTLTDAVNDGEYASEEYSLSRPNGAYIIKTRRDWGLAECSIFFTSDVSGVDLRLAVDDYVGGDWALDAVTGGLIWSRTGDSGSETITVTKTEDGLPGVWVRKTY